MSEPNWPSLWTKYKAHLPADPAENFVNLRIVAHMAVMSVERQAYREGLTKTLEHELSLLRHSYQMLIDACNRENIIDTCAAFNQLTTELSAVQGRIIELRFHNIERMNTGAHE